jgi:hypothetical protein
MTEWLSHLGEDNIMVWKFPTSRVVGAYATYLAVYALEVIEQLGAYQADNPILTPAPSLEFIDAAIERECARRVFWLIYISDALGSVLYRRPILADDSQLKIRLPVDETTFLFTVHDAVPG